MEYSIVELATKTHLLLASVDRFHLEQVSLVNKSKRQLFPVVLQRQQLADALARYHRAVGVEAKGKTSRWTGKFARSGGRGLSFLAQACGLVT